MRRAPSSDGAAAAGGSGKSARQVPNPARHPRKSPPQAIRSPSWRRPRGATDQGPGDLPEGLALAAAELHALGGPLRVAGRKPVGRARADGNDFGRSERRLDAGSRSPPCAPDARRPEARPHLRFRDGPRRLRRGRFPRPRRRTETTGPRAVSKVKAPARSPFPTTPSTRPMMRRPWPSPPPQPQRR